MSQKKFVRETFSLSINKNVRPKEVAFRLAEVLNESAIAPIAIRRNGRQRCGDCCASHQRDKCAAVHHHTILVPETSSNSKCSLSSKDPPGSNITCTLRTYRAPSARGGSIHNGGLYLLLLKPRSSHRIISSTRTFTRSRKSAYSSLRADFATHKASLAATIKNTVDNHTITVLEDYGVVSDFDGKRITTK